MTSFQESWRTKLAAQENRAPMMGRLFWAKPNKAQVVVGSLALLILIIYLDWITGPDIRFPLIYAIPGVLATWYAGRSAGYTVSILSALGEMAEELMGGEVYKHPGMAYWNASSRVLFFVMLVWFLTKFKDLSVHLGAMVEERTNALRLLAAQLSEAEDSERRRLAQDIHDSFSQMLSLLKLNLSATLAENHEGSPVSAAPSSSSSQTSAQRITTALSTVNELIQSTRTLMFDLHPPMLEHLGLWPTLRQFSQEFSRQAGIEITVSEEGRAQPLPRTMANYLFRSVKELVNNAAKHGHAREIVVSAHWMPSALRVIVDDDGSGFDPIQRLAPSQSKGLGLAAINERLHSLGGSFRIESAPGKGTRVVLESPISPLAAPTSPAIIQSSAPSPAPQQESVA